MCHKHHQSTRTQAYWPTYQPHGKGQSTPPHPTPQQYTSCVATYSEGLSALTQQCSHVCHCVPLRAPICASCRASWSPPGALHRLRDAHLARTHTSVDHLRATAAELKGQGSQGRARVCGRRVEGGCRTHQTDGLVHMRVALNYHGAGCARTAHTQVSCRSTRAREARQLAARASQAKGDARASRGHARTPCTARHEEGQGRERMPVDDTLDDTLN